MNPRRFAIAVLVLIAPRIYGATTPTTPVVDKGTIIYGANELMLSGSGFEPHRECPLVLFNGSELNLVSASETQIVATFIHESAKTKFEGITDKDICHRKLGTRCLRHGATNGAFGDSRLNTDLVESKLQMISVK